MSSRVRPTRTEPSSQTVMGGAADCTVNDMLISPLYSTTAHRPYWPFRIKNLVGLTAGGTRRDYPLRAKQHAGEVEEHGGGEAEGVDAVEHAGVAGDEGAVIAHAAIALDGAHRHPAGEAHECDHGRHAARLPG